MRFMARFRPKVPWTLRLSGLLLMTCLPIRMECFITDPSKVQLTPLALKVSSLVRRLGASTRLRPSTLVQLEKKPRVLRSCRNLALSSM